MLEIRGLRKKLENFTLCVDDLEIYSGEYFVFLGLSGAGKTTLLEIIAGFRRVDEGRIFLDGVDITNAPVNERSIVLCHGRYLFPHMSVEANIGYGVGGGREERKKRVREVAEMLGIEHLLKRKPGTLSMGEQQRVALARAIAVNPKVVLLDEPLNSLDRLTHESLIIELRRIHRETGTTFVHVTHDFMEAVSLAERMAILREGRIEQCGRVEEILRNPKNVFVASFVGVKNLLEGRIVRENGKVVFESGGLKVELDHLSCLEGNSGKAFVGIRPEDVLIVSNSNCRFGRLTFEARVVDVYPSSLSTTRVELDVDGIRLLSDIVSSKAAMMKLKKGDIVKCCVTSAVPLPPPTDRIAKLGDVA